MAKEYTQIKAKVIYRDKLKRLAEHHHRSMINMNEVLIDEALAKIAEKALGGKVNK